MTKILIDDKEYEAREGSNCLEAALENDLDLPYFCYHPALGSVGACRLCAVKQYKNEDDEQGRVVMSCMLPAQEGTRISIDDPQASEFRKWVSEWLMINHPHDCPICDEGGECHLQDMTVMTGHRTRRYRGKKRTHINQDLGPFINHEMNRCIQCYRCVRYYQDYAGGHDLVVMMQRNQVYFGRTEDGTLESPFAGNLVDICPTGVFTDKTYHQHYARKWDLATAPSICTQCGVGCNTSPGARYGTLRRVLPRYNEAVNGYFICDRGRFGYEFTNGATRLRHPLRKKAGSLQEADSITVWEDWMSYCAAAYKTAGIGSPRASLEANYALRCLVGPDNFFNGLSQADQERTASALRAYRNGTARTPTLPEMETADAIVVIGGDVTAETPRMDLAIRQAMRQGATLWTTSARRNPLDAVSHEHGALTPEEIATWLRELKGEVASQKAKKDRFVSRVAENLLQAERPLIWVAWYYNDPDIYALAADLAAQLTSLGKEVRYIAAFPEANTVGVGLMSEQSIDTLIDRIEKGEIERLIVLENDLFNRTDNPQRLTRALEKLDRLMVLDHTESQTTLLASDVVPVTTSTESNGTWVNAEGRAARAYQVYQAEPWVPQSWHVLRDMQNADGQTRSEAWPTPESIIENLAEDLPIFAPASDVSPPANFRQNGQKIPRLTSRFSGRMALPSIRDVRVPYQSPEDSETPFAFSMEGSPCEATASLIPNFWAPNWNSQESINKFQIELGRGLHSGAPGRRLFTAEHETSGEKPDTAAPGQTAMLKAGEILLAPHAEIFGSEATSRLSPAIRARVPEAYLEMNEQDADQYKVKEGDNVSLSWSDQETSLKVRINESVPSRVGVVPAGFPETRHILHTQVATIRGKA